jgi:hypothetical protein
VFAAAGLCSTSAAIKERRPLAPSRVISYEEMHLVHDLLGSRKAIHWLTGCDHVITLDLCKRDVACPVG